MSDKFGMEEISPRVRSYRERNCCVEFCDSCVEFCKENCIKIVGAVAVGIIAIVVLSLIIYGIYVLVTLDPSFSESTGDSWVDNIRFQVKSDIIVCNNNAKVTLRFNGTSYLNRRGDCKFTGEQKFDNKIDDEIETDEYIAPYYEKTYQCAIIGSNITATNINSQFCRYDGRFLLDFVVTNSSSTLKSSGNKFKLKSIEIDYPQTQDYSELERKDVKGFKWATGKAIAKEIREAFIREYAHPDYLENLNNVPEPNRQEEYELCEKYWTSCVKFF